VNKWDRYFFNICKAVGSNSKCLSRQVGAVIVLDHSIVSTGYNGPPRGTYHCGERPEVMYKIKPVPNVKAQCPRKAMGYKSGEGLQHCPAAHAETNAIANAARLHGGCKDSVLYLNCGILPCCRCSANIINAGIVEVVAVDLTPYDELGPKLLSEAGVTVRKFDLDILC
jgi:dCMP deaminase